MSFFKLGFLSIVIFLVSCATSQPAINMTPLEIQSMQTREYESNQDIVFPSVISVFQDLGYTIDTASKDTGLIKASSASESDEASKFWLGVTNVSQTKATAFIEQIGSITKARISFVTSNKRSSAYGQSDEQDIPVLDSATYQNAFERIENAIFIRSSN